MPRPAPVRDKEANRRIRLLLAVVVVVFAGVFARAVWLQGVHAASLGRLAEQQHRETVTVPAGRGTIYDDSGVPLAIGEQAMTVYADPRQVTQPRAVAVAAARLLGADPNQLYPKLLDKRSGFLYLQRFADPAKAARFMKKGFAGVNDYPTQRRTYPQGSVAAQVVGFAGTDNKGLGGLELAYDKQLSGSPGKQTIVRDPFGRALDVISSSPTREGRAVVTTLDRSIQAYAEQVLRNTRARWRAKAATATMIDPSTGAVMALAQAPGYNANKTSNVSWALQRTLAVTDTYEPGSTFKLVTISGALSQRIVTPQTHFSLPPCIHVADICVHDAEPRPTETLSVAQILAKSSNVGAITVAEKLGRDELMKWIERFGFGKTTGLDFPGESPGQVLPLDHWSGSTIGNVPIGQGIAVTPIQMAAAYAAIANGGVWVQPHLVQRVGGTVRRGFAHRRIVGRSVDEDLKQMLTGVVDEHGATGNQAAIPGYTVAGKTGTAQKPTSHGYSDTDFVASFVGMVPVAHPRFVLLVTVDTPHGDIFGGDVAAPAFAKIAEFALHYLAVPPDDPKPFASAG
jgi:cell division protein FtsI/penicillin-binding protein 2